MNPQSPPKKLSTKLIVVGILLLIGGGVAFVISRRKKALPSDGGGAAPPDTVPAPQVTKDDPNLLKLAKTVWKGAAGVGGVLAFTAGAALQHVIDEAGKPGQYLPLKGTLTINKVALPFDGNISPNGRVVLNGRKKHVSGQHFMLSGKLDASLKQMKGAGDGVIGRKSTTLSFNASR
mgnify:CR=1 FL=1